MLYNKILELQQFSINPSDVLEDQFDPQTEDYIERRKLLKEMKGQINQNSKDLDNVFTLISSLDTFKNDIRFLNKTVFNTEGLVNLSKIYGQVSTILRELVRSDKKLQKMNSYSSVYESLSSALTVNFFDLFNSDLDKLLLIAEDNNIKYNKKYPDFINSLELNKQVYIESFKEGSKL